MGHLKKTEVSRVRDLLRRAGLPVRARRWPRSG